MTRREAREFIGTIKGETGINIKKFKEYLFKKYGFEVSYEHNIFIKEFAELLNVLEDKEKRKEEIIENNNIKFDEEKNEYIIPICTLADNYGNEKIFTKMRFITVEWVTIDEFIQDPKNEFLLKDILELKELLKEE